MYFILCDVEYDKETNTARPVYSGIHCELSDNEVLFFIKELLGARLITDEGHVCPMNSTSIWVDEEILFQVEGNPTPVWTGDGWIGHLAGRLVVAGPSIEDGIPVSTTLTVEEVAREVRLKGVTDPNDGPGFKSFFALAQRND